MKKVMNNHTLRVQRTILKHSNEQIIKLRMKRDVTIYYRTKRRQMKHIPLKRSPNLIWASFYGKNEMLLIVIHASMIFKD